ncbi:MAG: hypothetical protein HY909_28375 [Deltaproteobacteria bacterium]|nr:hypothetical protein [Deltaproteobacteria bacterium]
MAGVGKLQATLLALCVGFGCSAGSNIVGGVVDSGARPDSAMDSAMDTAMDNTVPDTLPERPAEEPMDSTVPDLAPDTTAPEEPRSCDTEGCPAGQACCASRCLDITSDPSNCGRCGSVCGALPRTTVVGCRAGTCAASTCEEPQGDCDGVAVNGCETNLRDTNAHCGRCGNACPMGQFCYVGRCVRDNGPCMTNNDCGNDSRCQVPIRRCVPYNTAEVSPVCTREVRAGVFNPVVQCRFDTAPAGDPYPEYVHVLSTPMVADLRVYRRSPDDPSRPSIIAVFDDGVDGSSEAPNGLLRILDGRTCALQENVDEERVSHSSPPAVADLDGDGVPEIVAFKAGGGLVAFRYGPAVARDAGVDAAPADGPDAADGGEARLRWRVWWRSTARGGSEDFDPMGGGWAGPTIADVDDDGRPEVLRFGYVFNGQTGVLLGGAGQASLAGFSQGAFAVVQDVDEDGAPELVTGVGVFGWDTAMRDWVLEPYFTEEPCGGPCAEGHVAVANFGPYPRATPDGGVVDGGDAEDARADADGAVVPRVTDPGLPEVAVVALGSVRISTLDGRVVFGPVALPGGGNGGPPTVADFDGDGLPEVAVAGALNYTVFDPDCEESPRRPGGRCEARSTNGVLWTSQTQDGSSNITSSTSFDFEGDGRVELVYADECFVRVYDGRTGGVLASLQHSSCTWYENPVVADVDGDFRAEIVAASNFNCGSETTGISCSALDEREVDPRFAGLRCTRAVDCPSRVCADGFCRCTADAQCCRAGALECSYVCAAPPEGTPGMGNTCRTSRPTGVHGIRVYADIADNWVRSRTIWNQHAYNVTNISDTASVPRARDLRRSWREPGLNNFRTNVQGVPDTTAAPDVTVEGEGSLCLPRGVLLGARACNRGTAPLSDGIFVGFYDRDPALGGMRLCQVPTPRALLPGECLRVTCPWPTAPMLSGASPTAFVRGDDENDVTECLEGNNTGITLGAACMGGDGGVPDAAMDAAMDAPGG